MKRRFVETETISNRRRLPEGADGCLLTDSSHPRIYLYPYIHPTYLIALPFGCLSDRTHCAERNECPSEVVNLCSAVAPDRYCRHPCGQSFLQRQLLILSCYLYVALLVIEQSNAADAAAAGSRLLNLGGSRRLQ